MIKRLDKTLKDTTRIQFLFRAYMMYKHIMSARSKKELGKLKKLVATLVRKANLNKKVAKGIKRKYRIFKRIYKKAKSNIWFFNEKAKPFALDKAKKAGLDKVTSEKLLDWVWERCAKMTKRNQRKISKL